MITLNITNVALAMAVPVATVVAAIVLNFSQPKTKNIRRAINEY